MRRRRTGIQGAGLALVLVVGLAGGAAEGGAQSSSTLPQSRRGWLGISLEYGTVRLSGQERTVAAVSAVVPGSPAERAGIRAGDTLTHVDGQAVSPKVVATMSEGLAPGDLVRLSFRRQGSRREVLVEAAPWPSFGGSYPESAGAPFSPGPWFLLRLDSIRGAILRNLDSVAMAVRPARAPDLTDGPLAFPGWFLEPPGTGRQKEGLSSEADSLRKVLEQVNRALTELRRQELARLGGLRTGQAGGWGSPPNADPELRRLAQEEQGLLARRLELQSRLEELEARTRRETGSRLHAGGAPSQRPSLPGAPVARLFPGPDREARRFQDEAGRAVREAEMQFWTPLRILSVGQSYLAGAQLQDLNPQLARYFPVGRGVLVTQVLEGTPAAEAGVQGGDVIVRVGTQEVTRLEELRAALAAAQGPIRLEVVRRDGRKTLVIPR